VSSGEQQSVGEVLEAFRLNLPELQYQVVPSDEANYPVDLDGPGPLPLNRRAHELLGWSPRTSFGDGMRKYLAWIVANGPQ
jgi:nucleoside-diphosphate-sugar epimerase